MADYASSQPVRTETAGDVVAKIVDTGGSNEWSIDANNIGQVNLNDGTNSLVISGAGGLTVAFEAGSEVQITDGTDTLAINTDGSITIGDGTETLLINTDGSITSQISDGTDALDINADGSITSQISDGTDSLAVNTDGSINVNIVSGAVSGEVHDYTTTTAVAPNTPTTVVDYTVTGGTTLLLKGWQIACSGKARGELQVGPAASEVTQSVAFVTSSNGTYSEHFDAPIEVAAGDKVLVVMTNRDQANADLYAWINGNEV